MPDTSKLYNVTLVPLNDVPKHNIDELSFIKVIPVIELLNFTVRTTFPGITVVSNIFIVLYPVA